MCDGFSEAYAAAAAWAAANAGTIAAVSTAASVAGTVYSADQQRSAANKQTDAINANNLADHEAAQRTEDQLAGATAEQTSQRALQARRDLARIQTISGEGGGGVTSDRLASEVAFNSGEDQATIADNFKKQSEQIALGGAASSRSAASQLASVRTPSLVGSGLTIAGQALGSYSDYRKTQPVR